MTYKYIPKPTQGTRWAITDIHGCSLTLLRLFEKIALTKDDQLFLLGDYINRGPDSVGVIEFILKLQERNYQVFPLKGNHEDMLWLSHLNYSTMMNLPPILPSKARKRKGLINELGIIHDTFMPFFRDLPYYYETEDFYLVHAGFNLHGDLDPLQDWKRMMWLQRPTNAEDWRSFSPKKLIHGHFSFSLQEIQESIAQDNPVIHLDNGCYKGLIHSSYLEYGNLCALNLDTLELVVQENVDELEDD